MTGWLGLERELATGCRYRPLQWSWGVVLIVAGFSGPNSPGTAVIGSLNEILGRLRYVNLTVAGLL